MAEKNDISQELGQLNSSLVNTSRENVYAVPTNYFTDLPGYMLRRVKAYDANATVELRHLSPLLAGISKVAPYSVPAGYFDTLDIAATVAEGATAAHELAELSPLLSGLKKENPYSVPSGYFNEVKVPEAAKPAARVIAMGGRKIFRYAAAAVVTALVVISGFVFFGNNKIDPAERSYAWVEKNLTKVSTDDIDEFAELTEYGAIAMAESKSTSAELNEIRELVRDVPESELQEFVEETEVLFQDANTDEIILN